MTSKEIEQKWLKAWDEVHLFEADPVEGKPKVFVTFPFPYMDGPMHVGGGFTAARLDVYARFKRMQGYNVLFPWAWHWSGQPIVAASDRLARGDPAMIREFREIDKVPEEELRKFSDPVYMARYYTEQSKAAIKRLGFSIDWRREFHTSSLEPTFSRFVEWQYQKLKQLGYVSKGTHPVVWCPRDRSPTGDHDRLEGEGVTWEEYTLIKFPFDGSYLPAATFRPETIFGATNLWVNPDVTYVRAKVNGETWIVSRQAATKLSEQLRTVHIEEEFQGSKLVGKDCIDPVSGKKLVILPASFVDPSSASGIVYSVPAHAPYDWIALKDLSRQPEYLARFNLKLSQVDQIKPISMISVEGFSEYPAVEVCQNLGVKDQKDPKCDEATQLVYKKEFHSGILRENCGDFAGKRVSLVKGEIIEKFRVTGVADSMYDLPQPVLCRCTTRCVVKILEEQWFLKYSDEAWKRKARELLARASVYPESGRNWFEAVIEWLREWPCARRTGLGTPMPGADGWIVETLSDSTIYMAFYTIRKHIVQHALTADRLEPEVFDFIFLGDGDIGEVSKASGIPGKILEEMRLEFLYWYPVDLRNSGKGLVGNHLTFYIFHHAALFPPEQWPRALGVNGHMLMDGAKMSKSLGNIVTLKDVTETYGADVVRTALVSSAEGLDDPEWRARYVEEILEKLTNFGDFFLRLNKEALQKNEEQIDRWLLSVLQKRIAETTEALEQLKTRTAFQACFYAIWNDIRWYLKRVKIPRSATVKEVLGVWVRLLAPFAPFLAEEMYSKPARDGFVSSAPWPKPRKELISVEAELQEEMLTRFIEDARKVMKLIPNSKKLHLYCASPWKMQLMRKMLSSKVEGKEYSSALKEFSASNRESRQQATSLLPKLVKVVHDLGEPFVSKLVKIQDVDEYQIFHPAASFLSQELGVELLVHNEDEQPLYDPKKRASTSLPFRPAFYIE